MKTTRKHHREAVHERGAYLVMMALLLVILIGFGALTIDVGRVLVLRSEMQNAADAAAIAAAAELRGDIGAQGRATTAAQTLLQHDSKFAEVENLLGANIQLEFFCAIRAKYDPDADEVDEFCSNAYDANGYSVATSDAESHYVRVTLAAGGDAGAYTLGLAFLPVLGSLVANIEDSVGLRATATGGRSFYMCAFPPVMMCNPFESTGARFKDEIAAGAQIVLKQQGSDQWAPGNFSFLQPNNTPGGGAGEIASYLADASATGCRAPLLTTSTGAMTNQTSNGLNTRLDIYGTPGFNRPADRAAYPPAPNVTQFPAPLHDQNWRAEDQRFGTGDWNRELYFSTHHPIRPSGWDLMTRWEIYNWEIDSGAIPASGVPTNPAGDRERRTLRVAVVDCEAHNLNGLQTFPLVSPEGFAKLFLLQQVGKPPDADIHTEYVEWIDESDENFHTDVQIYE